MDFAIRLLISKNWKSETYKSILVIVDRFIKMKHYKSLKIIIDALALAEIINNVVVYHLIIPKSIISKRNSVFTSRFWFSLCYFFGINRKLLTTFHLKKNSPTEKENSIMEASLRLLSIISRTLELN